MDQDPKFRTPDEVRAFIKEDSAKQSAIWRDKYDRILRAKNAIWLLLLIVVFLQVYMLDVMLEATSLETRSLREAVNIERISCRPAATKL